MKTVTRPLWDFLLVLSLLCGFVGLAYASDLYDRINDWLLEYEYWQLDEFFLSSSMAMLLLAWYAWRRQQEAVQETYLHRQSEMALREAHNALEQRVAARTQELNRMNFTLQAEVAARQRVQEQLSHDTLHDALTGLPNRVLFLDRLRHAIEFAKRNEGYHFATLFLDIDHFKVVNDSFGHEIGNQLLIGMAQRLRLGLRSGDTVARLSGDEFVILLEDTKDGLDASMTAHRIQAELKQPFSLSGYHIFASASIGIVTADQAYDQPEDVLRDADLAMYKAKVHGKARYEVFKLTMREQAQTRIELENDLRYALERQELKLEYQPIVALPSEQITGFEALLRWHHPQRGLIAPLEFIPIAEETGLIVPIGEWVLRKACLQLQTWQTRFPQSPPVTMSVNVSGTQFAKSNFVDLVKKILREVGLDPTTLQFEFTESVWLNSSPEVVAMFKQLSDMGIQLQMDDFGTGYSSLAYLQHFPIRMLKIDRTFLNKMDDDNKTKKILHAMIAMAHDLGIETLAEGVETIEQLDHLKRLNCNYGQGYLMSRPVDPAAIEKLLNAQRLKHARLGQQKYSQRRRQKANTSVQVAEASA